MKKRSKVKHVLYLLLALAMLLYALPRLSFQEGLTPVSAFGTAWTVFALLIIGAHLHFILGVNEEKAKQLEAVRRAKLSRWESALKEKKGEPAN